MRLRTTCSIGCAECSECLLVPTDQACRRAPANRGQALRVAARHGQPSRPCLRLGRKNARGADRPKNDPLFRRADVCRTGPVAQVRHRQVQAWWIGSDDVFGRGGLPRIARPAPSARRRCKQRLRRRRHSRAIRLSAHGSTWSFRDYGSISSFMRKLRPSMTIVSAWCRTRSRMAEVSVLSLLKI